ncbi:SEL1-like repeat protein [Legionella quinlivanii]|uniref:SEL1-like repeat protein n=1 Tax=Legionella quinlivanii TaxID=45073 RepID=UPI002242F9C0|nr:tetratricopeptide repeat protein [Legionella quinlivanii]MCW8452317.1 sel1 repeat family protein [Legionella quinlivanii]
MSKSIQELESSIKQIEDEQQQILGSRKLSELIDRKQIIYYQKNRDLAALYYQAYQLLSNDEMYFHKAVSYLTRCSHIHLQQAENDLRTMREAEGIQNIDIEAYRHLTADELYANAMYFLLGLGQQNTGNAFALAVLAAEKGSSLAQNFLGLLYKDGVHVAKDAKEAHRWFQMAAAQGNLQACSNLGALYFNGEGVEQDSREAYRWFHFAAVQGFAIAQFNLGTLYSKGAGVETHPAEACKWFRFAAEQGLPIAQSFLALRYLYGNGVTQDNQQAFIWFTRAAEQGDASAQNNLGVMYKEGNFVIQSRSKAYEWFLKAVEKGDVSAQYNLGMMYYEDALYEEAYRWISLAAQQKLPSAQHSLGCLYSHGEGVERNVSVACKWFRRAAEQKVQESIEALRGLKTEYSIAAYHVAMLERNYKEVKQLLLKTPLLFEEFQMDVNDCNNLDTLLKIFEETGSVSAPLLIKRVKLLTESEVINLQTAELFLKALDVSSLSKEDCQVMLTTLVDIWYNSKENYTEGEQLNFTRSAARILELSFYRLASMSAPITDTHYLRQCALILIRTIYGAQYEVSMTCCPDFNQMLSFLSIHKLPGMTYQKLNQVLGIDMIKFRSRATEILDQLMNYLNIEVPAEQPEALQRLKQDLIEQWQSLVQPTEQKAREVLNNLGESLKEKLKDNANACKIDRRSRVIFTWIAEKKEEKLINALHSVMPGTFSTAMELLNQLMAYLDNKDLTKGSLILNQLQQKIAVYWKTVSEPSQEIAKLVLDNLSEDSKKALAQNKRVANKLFTHPDKQTHKLLSLLANEQYKELQHELSELGCLNIDTINEYEEDRIGFHPVDYIIP